MELEDELPMDLTFAIKETWDLVDKLI